ncbi:hypothetical protein SEA_REINDEER_158 [Mycobacterium phage Reindeer]|uniref:Uncharacterized protein n=1 Tax=Mycobacterium phage Reindeer TaxID=2762283 RepID=A0A7G8LI77_9CAUD|nr:hypothetical protein J4U05_gp094 [Mycobacterium phage Reindeer]QNJ56949.1 hypothetical protein SEA_REINDEER_158 [Mycobacterium phage Reindeer]
MKVFNVCHTCATAIVNADYSAFDDESELACISAFVESAGLLASAGTVDLGGYWGCAACGSIEIGTADVLETVD